MANELGKTTAVSIRLSDTDIKTNSSNATDMGHSNLSESIRTGIKLLRKVLDLQAGNNKLGYLDPNGKFVEIIFFL